MKPNFEQIAEAHEYLKQWVREEGFDDFGVMYQSGDTELLANAIVEAGVIDSAECYPQFKAVERVVEYLAEEFRKLSEAERRQRLDEAFKDVLIVECKDCNHVQFPDQLNFKLYEKELKTSCWECNSKNIEIKPWK